MDVLSEYVTAQIRCATAQCLDQLGFTQANSSCFDAMSDVMMLYLKKFCSTVKFCAEQRGQTTPCLRDVSRAFHFMRVDHHELYDYLKQVRSIDPPHLVPNFPVSPLEKWSIVDNHCQTATAVIDESPPVEEDEAKSTKFIPDFSDATTYSAGLISKSSMTRSSADNREKPKIKILLPLPPTRVSPLPSMDHKSCHMVSANKPEIESSVPFVSENSKSERENNDDPVSAKRKRAVLQDRCGVAITACGLQRTLINLPKKKIKDDTATDATKNEIREFVPKKESPRLIELREKLEKQRQMFKEVLEKARALLREEEEILEKPHTSVEQVESSTERKVPPLKLKVIRGPKGVDYEIVKPEFILHFKRSILLDSGLAEVTSTQCQESSGQQFAESQTSSKPHTERIVRKHEATRNKKAGTMPYLASDLMKNSYTVLTACMSGRAFPDLSCTQDEDRSEEKKIQSLNAEDSIRTQKVHEVIWQRLFSQDGIIGKTKKCDTSEEMPTTTSPR